MITLEQFLKEMPSAEELDKLKEECAKSGHAEEIQVQKKNGAVTVTGAHCSRCREFLRWIPKT